MCGGVPGRGEESQLGAPGSNHPAAMSAMLVEAMPSDEAAPCSGAGGASPGGSEGGGATAGGVLQYCAASERDIVMPLAAASFKIFAISAALGSGGWLPPVCVSVCVCLCFLFC